MGTMALVTTRLPRTRFCIGFKLSRWFHASIVTRVVPQGGVLSLPLVSIPLIHLVTLLASLVLLSRYTWCSRYTYLWASSIPKRYIFARPKHTATANFTYYNTRGITISHENYVALTMTGRHIDKYSLYILCTRIPFVRNHRFLGVTLYRSLTWFRLVKRQKKKRSSFVSIFKYISGTSLFPLPFWRLTWRSLKLQRPRHVPHVVINHEENGTLTADHRLWAATRSK